MTRAAALLLLAGCNQVFGLEEPSRAAADAGSCAGRWRAPVDVVNGARVTLGDWQVLVTVDTWSLIHGGKLQPSGADLRFTLDDGTELPYSIDRHLDTSVTDVFVRVPSLPVGTTRIWMAYGDPHAAPRSAVAGTFVADVIANPSFETDGGWEVVLPPGPSNYFLFPAPDWASEGGHGLLIDQVRDPADLFKLQRIQQVIDLPPGASYVMRFDANIVAASVAGPDGDNGVCLQLETMESYLFSLCTQIAGNITGEHLGLETTSISPGFTRFFVDINLSLGPGPGAFFLGSLDNFRVRKTVTPEPAATIGPEEIACPP